MLEVQERTGEHTQFIASGLNVLERPDMSVPALARLFGNPAFNQVEQCNRRVSRSKKECSGL